MTLGEHLQGLRLGRKLSLRKVVELSKSLRLNASGSISLAQLVNIEKGRVAEPGISKLATLARIYKIPLGDLTSYFAKPDSLIGPEADEIRGLFKTIGDYKSVLKEAEGLIETDPHRAQSLLEDELYRVWAIMGIADAARGFPAAMLPAREGVAPLSRQRIQMALMEPGKDGQNRRALLYFILALHGGDLEKALKSAFRIFMESLRVGSSLDAFPGYSVQGKATAAKPKTRNKVGAR